MTQRFKFIYRLRCMNFFDEHMRSIFLLSSSLSGVSVKRRRKKTNEKFNLNLQINKIILININQVLVEKKTVTIYQFFVHWLLHHITIIRFPTTFQVKNVNKNQSSDKNVKMVNEQ